jgi:hypothetical protein
LIAFGEAPVTLLAPLFLGRLDGRAVAIKLRLRISGNDSESSHLFDIILGLPPENAVFLFSFV